MTEQDFGAHVLAAAFDRSGTQCAMALGDGTLRVASSAAPDEWATIAAHDGAVLSLSQDVGPSGFITGGDDGRLLRIGSDGTVAELGRFGGKWVDHVASFADGKTSFVACSAGKIAYLLSSGGEILKSLAHPSTVTGLAIDAKGKRLAASHYNGASLWFVTSKTDTPKFWEWKGSHIGVALHPAGEALVTSMQENALHGWRLPDGHHMRMSGYPSKSESIGFTRNGRWLASSGADAVVLWPFFGGGPMGKPPLELAQIEGVLCTRCAVHPAADVVAVGYANGTVVVADIANQTTRPIAAPGIGAISALAWSPDGHALAWGSEGGAAGFKTLER